MLVCPVLFGLRDEGRDIVARRALSRYVRHEAFAARDAGFGEHSVEFHAGGADEGNTLGFLLGAGRLADDHDPRWDRAVGADEHAKVFRIQGQQESPTQDSEVQLAAAYPLPA